MGRARLRLLGVRVLLARKMDCVLQREEGEQIEGAVDRS
jgi:hypothetical protein